jgi:hypothetical protein
MRIGLIERKRRMMKVSEFEQAVDALGCGIEIDEVKLGVRGNFRRGYGHKGNILIMWDEGGRAFSVLLHTVEAGEVTHETHEGVTESCYERDRVYDLKLA